MIPLLKALKNDYLMNVPRLSSDCTIGIFGEIYVIPDSLILANDLTESADELRTIINFISEHDIVKYDVDSPCVHICYVSDSNNDLYNKGFQAMDTKKDIWEVKLKRFSDRIPIEKFAYHREGCDAILDIPAVAKRGDEERQVSVHMYMILACLKHKYAKYGPFQDVVNDLIDVYYESHV